MVESIIENAEKTVEVYNKLVKLMDKYDIYCCGGKVVRLKLHRSDTGAMYIIMHLENGKKMKLHISQLRIKSLYLKEKNLKT
ncbi:MAG: hypothetical protein QXQ91_02495 [Nanopusillaceae archaeon]